MGVNSRHEEYTGLESTWDKCLDFMDSEKAVKGKAETYLPRLLEQDDDEYASYISRTAVAMLAQRSQKAMVGMVTRKESFVEGSELLGTLLESIDSKKNDIHTYISEMLFNYFKTGRGATLVDVPAVAAPITVSQAEAQGVRPRFVYYKEKDLLNWRTKKVNNVEILVLVVLREYIDELADGDEFMWVRKERYRVLDLVNDKIYRQRLYDDGMNQVGQEIFPKMDSRFIGEIPIVIHGGIPARTPPLDQIVDLNLHHYQLSADEIHGLRMTALPTPYFFGEDPESDGFPTHIGPTRMIGSDNELAKIGFLEFTGAGLAKVADKLTKFEDLIAMLSVQLSTEQINKSATGSSIDYQNSTSSLAGIVQFLSAEMTKALRYMAAWGGVDPEKISIELNSDFAPISMTPQMLTSLISAYLQGTISYGTFYKNLAQGEITDPHKDPDEELREIEEAMPPGLESGADEGGGGEDGGDDGDEEGGEEDEGSAGAGDQE